MKAVFRAHTEPELIQQWMLGPPGWSMPSCVCELKVGGTFRYDWSDGDGSGFFLTGEFLELDARHRIVHVERMHLPDPTPDNRVDTSFTTEGTMEASYARLEASAATHGDRPG